MGLGTSVTGLTKVIIKEVGHTAKNYIKIKNVHTVSVNIANYYVKCQIQWRCGLKLFFIGREWQQFDQQQNILQIWGNLFPLLEKCMIVISI